MFHRQFSASLERRTRSALDPQFVPLDLLGCIRSSVTCGNLCMAKARAETSSEVRLCGLMISNSKSDEIADPFRTTSNAKGQMYPHELDGSCLIKL